MARAVSRRYGFIGTGRRFVSASPLKAPKLKALRVNPKVALTIDDNTFPHKVLAVRGTATLETANGIVPEYRLAAYRYFDEKTGGIMAAAAWRKVTEMVRIRIKPEWVCILDFQARFPSAIS
jgi:hypothetical protein